MDDSLKAEVLKMIEPLSRAELARGVEWLEQRYGAPRFCHIAPEKHQEAVAGLRAFFRGLP